MPKFPQTDAELRELAQKVIAGLQGNPFFPSPPVLPSDLQNHLDEFNSQTDAQTSAQAAAEQATDAKAAGREQVALDLKGILHYAEYAAAGDDAKLSMIGWGARAPRTPISEPGQPRKFQISRSGAGAAKATWARPAEGGHVACYIIRMRVVENGGGWTNIGTFVGNEAALANLETGKELEFCVVALNKAGESLPSNTASAVL